MIRLLRLGLSLLLLAVAGLYLLWGRSGALDRQVTSEIEQVMSEVAGTPVTLHRARVDLAKGSVRLEGLVLANPEGFRSGPALSLPQISARLDTTVLDPQQLWLREVVIDGAIAEFESGEGGSNLQRLLERIALATPDSEAGRQLVVDRLALDGASVRLSTPESVQPVAMPVPGLVLRDIGLAEGGMTGTAMAALVLRAILQRMLLAAAEPALRELIDRNAADGARQLDEAAGLEASRLRELLEDEAPR